MQEIRGVEFHHWTGIDQNRSEEEQLEEEVKQLSRIKASTSRETAIQSQSQLVETN